MEFKAGEAEINGINIYYREYGEGEPLLLIMGLSANADWWGDRFLEPLAARYHVVTFDNRGAGRSGKPEGPYTISQMAEDTAGLMDHLGWESAHIIGASMGGMIAQELALTHPERVKRLVLLCTNCGGGDQVPASPEVLALLNFPRTGITEEDMARLSMPLLFPQRYIEEHPEVIDEIVETHLIAPIRPKCFVWQLQAATMWSCGSRLPELRHPTLIATGTEDVLIPPENSRVLARLIPGSRLVEYEGTGHGFQAVVPEELAAEVLAFLEA